MSKQIIITEEQFNKLLNEELGISEEVSNKTLEVFSLLETVINTNKSIGEKNELFNYYNGSLTFDFLNCKVICTVNCYNFFNKEYFDYSKFESNGWSVYLNKNTCFMGVDVPMISGTVVKNVVIDTIQREIEHLYQQIVAGKRFSNEEYYATIATNINSNNKIVKQVAKLIYGTIKSEQDGFVNGLYAFLMSSPGVFSMQSLYKSECWKLYSEMITIYNELDGNQEMLNEFTKYKISKTKVRKSIDALLRKIGRVIIKVKQDKIKKQGWRY